MTAPDEVHAPSPDHALGRQLRGSSLLLAGRLLSKFFNFGIQVAIVRLLAKDDYGAFAYGLAIALAGELVVKFGLGRGANRYIPYYAERGERAEVVGTLALTCSVIIGMGVVSFAALAWVSTLGWAGFPSGQGGRVVLILAALAPVQALDTICIQTLACFAKPRAIFYRKHVLGPGLRAGAVGIVFLSSGTSEMLAMAYFAGGVIGVMICLRLTLKELYAHDILPLPYRAWRVPWRPLFRFSIPLISSDLVFITMTGVTTVLLMLTHGESGVASMRAIVPAAALNTVVAQSFSLLFMPAAIRVYAQGEMSALRAHHWQSSAWVAIFSFPIFALTFGVAAHLVSLLLGEAYADSASLLALLALGHYVSVCMGFNSEMLQVLERTRAIVWTDIMTITLGATLAMLLCAEYGAMGAAVAITAARFTGSLTRQIILLRTTDVGPVPPMLSRIWLRVFLAAAVVGIFGWIWQPSIAVQVILVAIVSLLLLRSTAHSLDLERSFPELLRIPLFAKLAGA